MSGPFFDPEVLKRAVLPPAEAEAFKLKAVKRYIVYADADGRILMEEADTDLLRARLIMEVALRRFERWSLRVGEQHRIPRIGDYPPAVQSVMDKMRTFLGQEQTGAAMDRTALYERKEDMSPEGFIQVMMQQDGDLILAINGRDSFGNPTHASAEFCTIGAGGGRSPETRRALIELMHAIALDNGGKTFIPRQMSNCPYDTDNDGDCPHCAKHGGCFLKQTARRMRPLIFGMEPWMFWLLLAVVIFAVIGPELAYLIRK